jgi:hypothetical protein
MKGERDLFRKQDAAPAEPAKAAVQPAAEPIAHDSKAVAAVLLAMLDDQLEAADAAVAAGAGRRSSNAQDGDASKRVAQRYASDGLLGGDDLPGPPQFMQPDAARTTSMAPAVSGDLQTFMQRFIALATSKTAIDEAMGYKAGRSQQSNGSTVFRNVPLVRTAMIAGVGLWLAIIIIGWIAR